MSRVSVVRIYSLFCQHFRWMAIYPGTAVSTIWTTWPESIISSSRVRWSQGNACYKDQRRQQSQCNFKSFLMQFTMTTKKHYSKCKEKNHQEYYTPDDLLADEIKNFVYFRADLSAVFRTRLLLRLAQHNNHSTVPQPRVVFDQRGQNDEKVIIFTFGKVSLATRSWGLWNKTNGSSRTHTPQNRRIIDEESNRASCLKITDQSPDVICKFDHNHAILTSGNLLAQSMANCYLYLSTHT